MVATIEKQTQSTSYIKDYQQVSEAWNKQMQQIISQWQTFFR